jgi:hypothetical protein
VTTPLGRGDKRSLDHLRLYAALNALWHQTFHVAVGDSYQLHVIEALEAQRLRSVRRMLRAGAIPQRKPSEDGFTNLAANAVGGAYSSGIGCGRPCINQEHWRWIRAVPHHLESQ